MTLTGMTPVTVRMPLTMRDRLQQHAAINRRSMNSEIVNYLDGALDAAEKKIGQTGPAIRGDSAEAEINGNKS